jgi:hypothetical protein
MPASLRGNRLIFIFFGYRNLNDLATENLCKRTKSGGILPHGHQIHPELWQKCGGSGCVGAILKGPSHPIEGIAFMDMQTALGCGSRHPI